MRVGCLLLGGAKAALIPAATKFKLADLEVLGVPIGVFDSNGVEVQSVELEMSKSDEASGGSR